MAKAFFEVFPSLKLKSDSKALFEEVQVERVSATARKDFIRVYITSANLIFKEMIFRVEEEIQKQLFPNANLTVKIYEKFSLSAQYTPVALLNLYRDSVLLEMKEYDHILYNLYRKAECAYPAEIGRAHV